MAGQVHSADKGPGTHEASGVSGPGVSSPKALASD